MTNKNKERCEVGCDSKNFPRGRSLHSSSSLSHLTRVAQPSCLVPSCVRVGPGRGQLVSQQCFSLARGVCTLTSLKIPEDRFRTRVSDRLPWKDLGQTVRTRPKENCSSTTEHTQPSHSACTIGKEDPTQRKKET